MLVIGYVVFFLLVFLALLSLFIIVLTVISMRRGRFYLPRLLKPGLIILESVVGGLWRAGKGDTGNITMFAISLRNQMNRDRFSEVPVDHRAIFLPQCLRSAECPADLTTEGLVCERCMRCEVGKHIDELEKEGKVFIMPGSTFVKRMMKKYRPQGIIGVGCQMEVKEGLEMTDRMDIVAMGVVTSKDGCVETTLDWEKLLEIARLRKDSV